MRRIVLIYLGGGVGATLRALLLATLADWDRVFPVSVLAVNLAGAFILGAVVVLADEAGLLSAERRLFLAVGVLGGFTTFSTFGWGVTVLIGGHQGGAALVYVGASVIGGFLAVGLGLVAGRELVGLLERAAIGLLQRLNSQGQRRLGDVRVDVHQDVERLEAEQRGNLARENKEHSA